LKADRLLENILATLGYALNARLEKLIQGALQVAHIPAARFNDVDAGFIVQKSEQHVFHGYVLMPSFFGFLHGEAQGFTEIFTNHVSFS